MPGSAGTADDAARRYEHWWALAECVRLLHGATETLRIEVLGDRRAELVTSARACRELHHVRRGQPGAAWSLADLDAGDDRLLHAVGDALAGNGDRWSFVSAGAAPELSALCRAAQDAGSAEAFADSVRAARPLRTSLARLRRCWTGDTAAAFDRLQRIDVRTLAERDLEHRVRWGLRALFARDIDRILAALLDALHDARQRTLTRRQIVDRLARRGARPRRLDHPDRAGDAVAAATDRYLNEARRRLIRGAVIPREAAATLVARLDGAPSESVLTGRPGAGKTACVVQLADVLRDAGTPVLAFRIDQAASATTTADLGRRLELEESPVLLLAEAAHAAGRPGVLVIDQLDAAAGTAGPVPDPCILVERLLHEVRGAVARATLHTVIVCRDFDWRNDPRLRRLVPRAADRIDVGELAPGDVERILRDGGADPAALGARQLHILRLPQHLLLFLEGRESDSAAPAFASVTALFDRYWNAKRRAVAERAAPLPDQWMEAVTTLCDELHAARENTAPCERLDVVSPAYLQHLAAEGVVSLDGRRCGFGHETFFDYCAARVWFRRRESLAAWLTGAEQHLSRRVRFRQTLTYLRDADPALFVRETGALLADKGVRPHIKDLALAVLADVPDPTEHEWTIWERWLAPALGAIAAATPNPDPLSAIAWRRFFESRSWFAFAERHGIVAGWLASDNDRLAAAALGYLQRHDEHAPDRVAALLEPYADVGGPWTSRLRFFMESAAHHASRRLFDLFLRLIANGALDEARRRDAANGTFWSMLAGLGAHRPAWVPEVLAARLRRRLAAIRTIGEDAGSQEPPGYDDDAARLFRDAAARAPDAFVEHVLAPVLDISDATLTGRKPPRHDAVWPIIARTTYPEVDHACLVSLCAALATVAGNPDADLRETVAALRARGTHTANCLLLALYRGGAAVRADAAAAVLGEEPWRLQCGFSDSPQWYAAETIRTIYGKCSDESRERIEHVLCDYVAPEERGLFAFRKAGRARFALLSAIPPDLRGARAQAAIAELQGRFGQPEPGARDIAVDSVEPPMDRGAAEAMTDEEWLHAIAASPAGNPAPAAHDDLRGSAGELARSLEACAEEDPERFARLVLQLPPDAHPVCLERILTAVAAAGVDTDLALAVCRKTFAEARDACGQPLAALLGDIADPLPDDAVRMLHWIATEHPDPASTNWPPDDPGATARGSAADAVRRLIGRDADGVARFRTTLERLIHDPSPSVRVCAAETLGAVAARDPELGTKLFLHMDLSEDRLLAAPPVYRFVRDSLQERFVDMRPVIERMLAAPEPEVCEAGARLASLAALEHAGGAGVPEGAAQPAVAAMSAQPDHRSAAALAADALRRGPAHRLGAAHVAAANLAIPEYRAWSAATLAALFDDDDIRVRRRAATCFAHLGNGPLDAHGALIEAFSASRAFGDDPAAILGPLEASRERLPDAACTVCERFLDRFRSAAARDAHPDRGGDGLTVATLAFRLCQQHPDDDRTSRALDLVDRICFERIGEARDAFEGLER